jgi:hypothetical protein
VQIQQRQHLGHLGALTAPWRQDLAAEPCPLAGVPIVCVPKTSSTSCDQAIFVDQATDACPFTDAVLAEIDRLG